MPQQLFHARGVPQWHVQVPQRMGRGRLQCSHSFARPTRPSCPRRPTGAQTSFAHGLHHCQSFRGGVPFQMPRQRRVPGWQMHVRFALAWTDVRQTHVFEWVQQPWALQQWHVHVFAGVHG
jgi:hypothetical protein